MMIDKANRYRRRRLASAAALVMMFTFGIILPVQAQVMRDAPPRIGQSFVYLEWNLKGDTTDESRGEWVVPVSGMLPLGNNAELRYFTALAGASAAYVESDHSFSGLTDTRIQVARTVAEGRLLLSAGLNLPTGKKKLDSTEFAILSVLSAEHFNFPVKTFGEGFGIYTEVLGAAEAGEWLLGGGLGVLYSGAYEPRANEVSYRPGLRLYFTGSAEVAVGEHDADRLKFDGVFLISAADQADDEDVFQDGLQLDLSAYGMRQLGAWLGGAELRAILRGKDKRLADDGTLVAENYASSGSEFRVALRGGRAFSDRWRGLIDFTGKFVGANSYPEEESNYEGAVTLFGIGGQVTGQLSDRTTARLGLRKWLGSAEESGRSEKLELSGWEITQGITITF